MQNVAVRACSWLSVAYARLCYRTSRFEISDAAEECLRATWDAGIPTVYVYWHDEFLVLSLNASCPRIQYPVATTNDSFGGRVMHAAWSSVGAPVVRLRRNEPRETRIARVIDAVLTYRKLVVAADYGRPWFRARPTASQVAAATAGYVVAMHLDATRKISFRIGEQDFQLPLPFGRYTLRLSAPMRDADASAIEEALWSLRGGTSTGQPRAREAVIKTSDVACHANG